MRGYFLKSIMEYRNYTFWGVTLLSFLDNDEIVSEDPRNHEKISFASRSKSLSAISTSSSSFFFSIFLFCNNEANELDKVTFLGWCFEMACFFLFFT